MATVTIEGVGPVGVPDGLTDAQVDALIAKEMPLILAKPGQMDRAREILSNQALAESPHPGMAYIASRGAARGLQSSLGGGLAYIADILPKAATTLATGDEYSRPVYDAHQRYMEAFDRTY